MLFTCSQLFVHTVQAVQYVDTENNRHFAIYEMVSNGK